MKVGNGLWEKAKFNDRLQVTEFGLGRGAENMNLWKLNLEYGELQTNGTVDKSKNTGNLAKQTISFDGLAQPFVQTYKYDSLYRITEAKETNNGNQTWIQNFGYDRYGNRTTLSQNILGQQLAINKFTHPTIDPNTNRFDSGQDYSYDKVGNLTADADNRSFTFDGNNKQILVTNLNSHTVGEYFYDGNGKRVKKKSYVSGVLDETVIFVYSGGKLVEEFSTKTPPTNPQTKYVATDHLESIRVLSNQDGEIISRRDFMPFGEELQSDTNYRKSNFKYNSDDVRQKFTSYEKDKETGLDYAQARMYQNQHARFTAVDPLLASGKSNNPQTFNRYVYVMNSPLQYVDPDGLQAGKWYDRGAGMSPIYVPNSQGMVDASWKKITTKNNRGHLVYGGIAPEGYQVRLNPYGPYDSENFWHRLVFETIAGTDYSINGWDYVLNDERFSQFMRTGTVHIAIHPHEVALLTTPLKGRGAIKPRGGGLRKPKVNVKKIAQDKLPSVFKSFEGLPKVKEGFVRIYRGTGHPKARQVGAKYRNNPSKAPSGADDIMTRQRAKQHVGVRGTKDGVSATTDIGTAQGYNSSVVVYDIPQTLFDRLPKLNPLQGEVTFKHSIPDKFRIGTVKTN